MLIYAVRDQSVRDDILRKRPCAGFLTGGICHCFCACVFFGVFHLATKGRLPIFNIVRIFFSVVRPTLFEYFFVVSLLLNVVNLSLVPSANFAFKLKVENS